MSYTPHTWRPGEIISSARLNALEQGIAAEGGGNGSSPDILIKITGTAYNSTSGCYVVNSIELAHYDHDALINKIVNGEPVFGYAYELYPYRDDIDGCSNYNRIIPLQSAFVSANEDLIDPSESGPTSDPRYCWVQLRFCNMKPGYNGSNVNGIYVDDLTINIFKVFDSVDQEYSDYWNIEGSRIGKYKALS